MKQIIRQTLLLLFFFGLIPGSHMNSELLARRYSPGKPYFEKAYFLEKSDPEKAIRLYHTAIRAGLERKLRHAANWRLYYLYRDGGYYARSLRLLVDLGSAKRLRPVFRKLKKDIMLRWRIGPDAAGDYIRGIALLNKISIPVYKGKSLLNSPCSAGRPEDTVTFLSCFHSANRAVPENNQFRLEIVQRLIEAGYGNMASDFAYIPTLSENERLLQLAETLIVTGQENEAENTLYHLAEKQSVLSVEEKSFLLYLLGRIQRNRNNTHRAIAYFRLSARLAPATGTGNRRRALAAYTLYRDGYKSQAAALIGNLKEFQDENIRVLVLLLRVEVNGDMRALKTLKVLNKNQEEMRQKGVSAFLINQTGAVLARGRDR